MPTKPSHIDVNLNNLSQLRMMMHCFIHNMYVHTVHNYHMLDNRYSESAVLLSENFVCNHLELGSRKLRLDQQKMGQFFARKKVFLSENFLKCAVGFLRTRRSNLDEDTDMDTDMDTGAGICTWTWTPGMDMSIRQGLEYGPGHRHGHG
jgi:hypothetical protein